MSHSSKSGHGRPTGLTETITAHIIEQVDTRLRAAHLTAANAKSFSSQGLTDRSVETLLDIDQLIFETKALLETVTILRREHPR